MAYHKEILKLLRVLRGFQEWFRGFQKCLELEELLCLKVRDTKSYWELSLYDPPEFDTSLVTPDNSSMWGPGGLELSPKCAGEPDTYRLRPEALPPEVVDQLRRHLMDWRDWMRLHRPFMTHEFDFWLRRIRRALTTPKGVATKDAASVEPEKKVEAQSQRRKRGGDGRFTQRIDPKLVVVHALLGYHQYSDTGEIGRDTRATLSDLVKIMGEKGCMVSKATICRGFSKLPRGWQGYKDVCQEGYAVLKQYLQGLAGDGLARRCIDPARLEETISD
jgi:hypothetical protein